MKHSTIKIPRRREQVLAFILQWIVRNNGSSPTYEEIGLGLGFGKSRAKQLVEQLVVQGIIRKTPGAQRNLRVVDVSLARDIVVQLIHREGGTIATPMGELQQPYPNVQLPRLPEIRHLPDE